MFAATRSRCGGLAVLVALLCACVAAPAWGAVPSGYAVKRVDDGATPTAGLRLGSQVANVGDLDGDGTSDVAIGMPTVDGGKGEVLIVSGATGAGINRIPSPFEAASAGAPAGFGTSVAALGDVQGCSGSPGGDCINKGAKDGFPEFIVGAPGADISTATERTQDQGRAYVIDGATGAIANRVQLAGDDIPLTGKAEFGYSVLSPGDLGKDGEPDIVVGAPGYTESDSTYCEADICTQVGRVYGYYAGQLSGVAAGNPIDLPVLTIDNPFAAEDKLSQRLGHSLSPLADIGQCTNQTGGGRTCLSAGPDNVPSNTPDGVRDFMVSVPLIDQGANADAGAALVIEGATGLVIKRVDAVDPRANGRFGSFSYGPPAPPDLGGAPQADLFVGAPQDGSGRAFIIDSDVTVTITLASLDDPSPVDGGGFGATASGLVSGGIAVGAPFGARAGMVRLFGTDRALAQTICDPDGQLGAGFGAAIATLGDVNGDGFDELAVGAPDFDHPAAANAGRLYILTSKGPAGADAPGACVSTGAGTSGGGGGNGGGGEVTPPDDDTVVIARVLRRLVLRSNRKRVRKDATIRLRGKLTAAANRSVCQNRQKIALQRRRASGGRFQTFEVALTRATGRFTARAIAERTFVYRARVSQTARCMGAVSKTAKVSILRKRGSR